MITVYVTAGLIDKFLRTGNQTQRFRIRQGIPTRACLVNVYMRTPDLVALEFYDPEEGPHREIEIIFESLTREPSTSHPLIQLDAELRAAAKESA